MKRTKKGLYPFEYEGKLWHREDCNEAWRVMYEDGCGTGYDGDPMAIYISDGCCFTPHKPFSDITPEMGKRLSKYIKFDDKA